MLCQQHTKTGFERKADVFLEARSTHEMQRNALVAVFLKALERFHSTLFLTTNRVETFDPAFISRFSIAVKYSDLDTSARKAIWKRFLGEHCSTYFKFEHG